MKGVLGYLGRAESGQAGISGSSGREVIKPPAGKRTVLTNVLLTSIYYKINSTLNSYIFTKYHYVPYSFGYVVSMWLFFLITW